MTPFEFGWFVKLAQMGTKAKSDIAPALTELADPLGVGGFGPRHRMSRDVTQLLGAPKPMSEVFRSNITAPVDPPPPPKPKRLEIWPSSPRIRLVDPNKQTT